MKPMLTILAGMLLAATAHGGDVYVVTDAQGNRVYTDRPQTLPAERVDVQAGEPNAADAARAAQQMEQAAADSARVEAQQTQATEAARARQLTAEDQAKRCVEARQRYQSLLDAQRLFETDESGERRYLSSEEIDAARSRAKQAMDTFCAGN
jgi:tRNA A37 threonylcarbamoyladenosine modification protein TsaB